MKRVLSVWLFLFALLLSGCGEQATPEAVPALTPQTVDEEPQRAVESEPEPEPDTRPAEIRVITAHPADYGADCYAEVYESLYLLEDGNLVPLLAEGSPVHESGTAEYAISLRRDIFDSEGRAFGAAEAAASYEAYAEARGDKLLLTAESTETGDLQLVFSRELEPVEEEQWLTAVPLFGSENHGTGPYRIESESEDALLLVPNERYEGASGRQNVQSIRYLFIESAAEKVIALETDRADMANGLSYEDAEDFLPAGSYSDLFTTVEHYGTVGRYLLPNVGKGSALESEEKRLALFAAIDCAALAETMGGQACTALGNPDCPELRESFQSYQTEVSTGRASPAVRITLLCPQSGAGNSCASVLAARLEGKGYSLLLRPLSSEEYTTALDSGEGWDLALVETPPSRSVLEHWTALWSYADNARTLRGGLTDATLINLLETLAEGKDTAGDCVRRLQERVYNHGLALALPQMNEPRVLPLWVTKAVLDPRGGILPGECEYER